MHTKVICGYEKLEFDAIYDMFVYDALGEAESLVKVRPIREATHEEYAEGCIAEGASVKNIGKLPFYYFVQVMD